MPRKGRSPALTREQCLQKYGVEKLPSDPSERMKITRPWEKSTGPVTELGKFIVSLNNLQHGLTSKNPVVRFAARVYWEQVSADQANTLRPYLQRSKLPQGVIDLLKEIGDSVQEAS